MPTLLSVWLLVTIMSTSVPRPAPTPEPLPSSLVAFFRYLRSVAPTGTGKAFVPQKPIDPEIVLQNVSSKGLFFSDVSPGAPGQVDVDRLRKEIRKARGDAFRYLVHLSYVVFNTERLGEAPEVVRMSETQMRVDLGSEYQLTFVHEGSDWRMTTVSVIDPYGD